MTRTMAMTAAAVAMLQGCADLPADEIEGGVLPPTTTAPVITPY